jgi:membrane-associated phospholipid phosphatase
MQFNSDLVQFFVDHRNVFLTKLFLAASFFGEVDCYVLIAILIYVMWDKKLAIRLSVVVLLTMSLNHILKIIIKNPRPFIREGTYLNKWAVSAANARELAAEYSTPSAHAMASSAFYSCLYAFIKNRYVRVVAVPTVILIGLSRPYLGVHYVEDILIGWAIGLSVALVAVKYAGQIGAVWNKGTSAQVPDF